MKANQCFLSAWPAVCAGLVTVLLAQTVCQAENAAQARALFRNPPREYSTGPLWVWNDMLTEDQVRSTLRDMAAQKVKQVWVHPRPGLMTPYLSADWFRLWKIALQEAQRLDMNVWIYDENSYPSGFAGGWVPEVMPESRGRGLTLKETKAAPKSSDGFVAVYRLEAERAENVSAHIKAGETMPDGAYIVAQEVRAANSPWHGDRCYVNLLSPGVTEKFLELTLEPYRREIGQEFGKRVPGVFTDEPNIRPAGGFPWSETLAQEFQKRWGYDLLDRLPSLSRPIGDWRKVRHDYYQVLNEQFIEHWAKPYHDYCEKHHLAFTGHYWDHEWPNCAGVPDNMAMYAWHQWPAIDCLMNQYSEHTHAQFGNARMVKELSSVANQLGMKRTLCEAYGAGGWDLRFEDMKRIGDWLEVLGVNTLNQHLSYVTLRGARKRDHPQSFSYHEPWWDAYHVSAEYFARLSAALCQGEQVNRLLVIEPTTTAWMYQGDAAKLKELGDSFFSLIMALEAAQVEYDLASEDVLARHGSVQAASHPELSIVRKTAAVRVQPSGSELKVGRRAYSQVLVPNLTENLNLATVSLLEGYLHGGGQVLSLGEPPARIEGGASDRVQILARHPGWTRTDLGSLADLASRAGGSEGFAITRQPGDKGKLFHHRRELSDGQLVFLVNTSIESPSEGDLETGLQGVEKWDLYTGKCEPYPFLRTDAGATAHFKLPPSGSLLLFLSGRPLEPAPAAPDAVTVIHPAAGPDIRRLEPNVLTLDCVDVTAGGETKPDIYFYQANQFAWQKNGMARDPWDSAVQFKDELITRTFPAGSGFEASYKFQIDGSVPKRLEIVIERPDLYQITCNGQPVKERTNTWWLDKAFGRIDLALAARTGQNLVTIKATPFTMFHELEPAYLLGDFALKPAEKGFLIVAEEPIKLGPGREGWNTQGYPFYSAGMAYCETFEITKRKGRYSVFLPDWKGSVAKVTVNGKPAGYIDAPPWECEVTPWVKRGSNKVEVTVIGTLKNTLGPHHGNPALGAAWPSAFHRAPSPCPPPGTAYSTVAYGLFQPFVIKQK